MRLISAALAAALLVLWGLPASAQSPAQSTLDTVKKRGHLVCGVNGTLPGFSLHNALGQWEGLDVDLCRAVAAAVFSNATKVEFVPQPVDKRFEGLRKGDVDLLARNTTVTLERDSSLGVQFAAINYYDGQAFVVPKGSDARSLTDLRSARICVTRNTTHELGLQNWFQVRQLPVTPTTFDSEEAMYAALLEGRCDAATQDATALIATLVRRGKGPDFRMLPEIISKEPFGIYVRAGDTNWLDIVRWSHNAMIEAEELQITRDNVDRQRRESHDAMVRRLLGAAPGNGKALGLDEKWAFNIIAEVGNYGESFERNLGGRSALGLRRGLNALWTGGGQMYPLPSR